MAAASPLRAALGNKLAQLSAQSLSSAECFDDDTGTDKDDDFNCTCGNSTFDDWKNLTLASLGCDCNVTDFGTFG